MSTNTAPAPEDNEPSMEEILASIRKIIADDSLGTKKDDPTPKKSPKPAAPVPEAAMAPPEPVEVEVVVPVVAPDPVPEAVLAPEPVATDVALHDDEDDILDLAEVASVPLQAADVHIPAALEEESDMMPEPVEVMVSVPSAHAPKQVEVPRAPIASLSALEDRIMSDNTSVLVGQAFATLSRQAAMPAVGRSIEDVVVELLRPMLRGWVDEHLPSIVEKLVKAEIERVARGS